MQESVSKTKAGGILIGSVLLCNCAGLLGSLFTTTGPGSWYSTLIKPAFNPPAWIFAPVWTLLYILMGISLYLVIMEGIKGRDVRIPLLVFTIQLILNILWSYAFFGLESTFFGLLVIILLWISIVATMILFYPVRKAAAWLLVPYILWVSFATLLTYTIYSLN
ncbi:MAG: TspO/MBR family protein [Methanomicrobiales archaeon]|jgi:tryptophan-rich sensory protein|nr:tryptophan-rich sensory protein [Burkholderiaceae bacterium]NLH26033.1 tryptophan-rich sensory protein [Methanomicrobiales archaeon]HMZ31423.1 tryptophan-rich sensory protein [Methanoregulaceae archaeon]HNI41069.1 tryptophan-rich sensory protein [Methanoregulaceae archaeon]HNJ80158.1 tryptophan-rich sensory protein [Methanoregulaceae archaeon]